MAGPGLLPSGHRAGVGCHLGWDLAAMPSADGWLRPVQKFTERSLQTAATSRTVIVPRAPNGGSDTQSVLSLRAVLSLRPGEAAGELTDVVSADQLAHDGVAGWRHCPVIAGCAAMPDPPPRVLAPEPLKFGILVVPAWPGVHGRRREVVGRPRCCGRRAGAWMAAGAMQLPPSQWNLRRRRARSPAPGSGGPARAAGPVIPLTTWAAGYGADRRSGSSGSLIACPRSGHCADAFG